MQSFIAFVQAALGLGFVIFVHELGHFLVAKACGVRCDKFFVGFDIGGLKLSRKWGETEYGIGILPLGGYVKMFGQDDNAANIAKEIEESQTLEGSPEAKQITGPDGEPVWVHRRSYLAKSVPQRMAIISAGVIMNVIFAAVFAFIAYGLGVPEQPAVVGYTLAGSPAWEAGMRTGDRIVRVNDIDDPSYQTLVEEVVLGDQESGVDLVIERVGGGEQQLNLKPQRIGPASRVGIGDALRPVLAAKDAVRPNTPAARLGDEGFQDADYIVTVDDSPITSYADLKRALTEGRDQPLEFEVLRGGKPPAGDPFGEPVGAERARFTVDPNPRERLGVVPTLGPIASVAADSPAAEAGLEVDDQIVAVDGTPIGAPTSEAGDAVDPVVLDEMLAGRAMAGESVTLTVVRDEETLDVSVEPRVAGWTSLASLDGPTAIDSLGVACVLEAKVAAITPDSPASAVDLQPGDRIVTVTVVSDNKADGVPGGERTVKVGEGGNWGALVNDLQDRTDAFLVRLVVARPAEGNDELQGGEPTRAVELKPESVDDSFTATRGVKIQQLKRLGVAESFGEQVQLAVSATGRALSTVVRFVQGLGSGQVSIKGAGGPVMIAKVAGGAAYEGFGKLLMTLTLLSANLAVLNFLPIPVLDGGHMVFLMYEGITGRPVNERVMIALQTLGLLFLLGLMLFITTLDIGRLFGWAM